MIINFALFSSDDSAIISWMKPQIKFQTELQTADYFSSVAAVWTGLNIPVRSSKSWRHTGHVTLVCQLSNEACRLITSTDRLYVTVIAKLRVICRHRAREILLVTGWKMSRHRKKSSRHRTPATLYDHTLIPLTSLQTSLLLAVGR